MKITKEHVGKIARIPSGLEEIQIYFVGEDRFFGRGSNSGDGSWPINDKWEIVESKKKPSEIIKEKLSGLLIPFCGDQLSKWEPEKSAEYANKRIDKILEYLDEQGAD